MSATDDILRPRLLASVRDLAEVEQAVEAGTDIVDLKDPTSGALGAWPVAAIAAAVRAHGHEALLSATTGDLPMQPLVLVEGVRRVAGTGVPIVKVGLFTKGVEESDLVACIEALAPLTTAGVHLVGVAMADQAVPPGLLSWLAAAGFHGAMLDTAGKNGGTLLDHRTPDELATFVGDARGQGLLTGLAGSLRLEHVAPLAALAPDYLGFRGALCEGGRTGRLDPARLAGLVQALRAESSNATATAGKQVRTLAAMPGGAPTSLAAER